MKGVEKMRKKYGQYLNIFFRAFLYIYNNMKALFIVLQFAKYGV